jgi:hypothetical protein
MARQTSKQNHSDFGRSVTFASLEAARESHKMKSGKLLPSHSFVPSPGFISSPDLSFSHNLFTEHGFVNTQINGRATDSVFALSLGFVNSQTPPESQNAKSDSFLLAQRAVFSLHSAGTEQPIGESQINGQTGEGQPSGFLRSGNSAISLNFVSHRQFTESETDQSRGNCHSGFAISVGFLSLQPLWQSQTRKSEIPAPSHSFVPSPAFVSSEDLEFSLNFFTERRFVNSQINGQTRRDISSDSFRSLEFVGSQIIPGTQTAESERSPRSGSLDSSSRFFPSKWFSLSLNPLTACPFIRSQPAPDSDSPRSLIFGSLQGARESHTMKSRFVSMKVGFQVFVESRFLIAQTSRFVSMKRLETVPVQVSHSNIPSDLNVSPDPFNHNLQGCSPQWSSSNKVKSSVFAGASHALETTTVFLSNALMTTHSDFPSIVFRTAEFRTLGNDKQLKVSTDPVKITSAAVSGGALIVLVTIICLCVVLDRRHNRYELEEPDLGIEHNEEEFDDEDENVFDLGDDGDKTNSNALSESGHDFRMDFDGDESFSSLFTPGYSAR